MYACACKGEFWNTYFFQMCYHINLYYEYILLVEEIGIIGDIDVFPIKK
jgi:hypothetical protein